MFMGLREGQWTLLISSCVRSTNRVNLRAREHADSQNIWIHPRMIMFTCRMMSARSDRHSKKRLSTNPAADRGFERAEPCAVVPGSDRRLRLQSICYREIIAERIGPLNAAQSS